MKKRILALVCALALILTLCPAAPAADVVYITAINDAIPEIDGSSMPFWSGGYLYVSCAIFKEFGIDYNRSVSKQSLVLYRSRGGGALIFDMKNNLSMDSQNNIYIEPAVVRNGQVFVPVGRVAEYFGLIYTYTKISYGYLVRIRNSSSILDDAMFLDAASERLAYRYNQYQQSLLPSADPQGPAAGTEPEEGEPSAGEGHNLYISVLVEDTEQASGLLDALGTAGSVTFYLQPELLESAGDLTRRMLATGHALGLTADAGGGAGPALEQLHQGNRMLSRATGSKTRLVWLDGASEQTAAEVEAAGYCVLSPQLDYAGQGLTGSGAASGLLSRVGEQQRANVTVWLGGGVNQAGLRALLSSAAVSGDQLLPMTEAIR